MRKHNGMRPQDVVIILKLITQRLNEDGSRKSIEPSEIFINNQNKFIASSLQMSGSEVSESLRRSEYGGLISDRVTKKVNQKSFLEFLLYGIKYVFPTHPEGLVRGIPTAHSALPLQASIVSDELFVWKHPEGTVRGQAVEPLYPTVPMIIQNDSNLYKLLSLVDAIRTGNARIINVATKELETRILGAW